MFASGSLLVLLKFVISTYLQRSRCLIAFSNENFNLQLEIPFLTIKVINGTYPRDVLLKSFGCEDMFIETNEPSKFLDDFEDLISKHKQRFTSRRYLFLSDRSDENFKRFFRNNNLKFILDILYVIPRFTDSPSNVQKIGQMKDNVAYELWTHEFGGPENKFCKPRLVDVWFSKNSSFLYNNYLYPDKISDQNGKTIKVATITYPPYAVVGKKYFCLCLVLIVTFREYS